MGPRSRLIRYRACGKGSHWRTRSKIRFKKRIPPVSQQVYQEFHGEPPSETVIVEKKVHFHKHLASAGELRKLEVRRRVDRGVTTLTRFKGALLAFNEAKNQLFVEGGDQTSIARSVWH